MRLCRDAVSAIVDFYNTGKGCISRTSIVQMRDIRSSIVRIDFLNSFRLDGALFAGSHPRCASHSEQVMHRKVPRSCDSRHNWWCKQCAKLHETYLPPGAVPMFLKRIVAPVRKCLFSRGAREQHLTVEECVIAERLRELTEVTPQVSPTLPGGEGVESAVQAGDA